MKMALIKKHLAAAAKYRQHYTFSPDIKGRRRVAYQRRRQEWVDHHERCAAELISEGLLAWAARRGKLAEKPVMPEKRKARRISDREPKIVRRMFPPLKK